MTDSPVDQLAKALDQAEQALDTVRDDNLDSPTPCADWSVRQLAAHLASSPARFAQMGRGEEVDWAADPGVPDGEWPQAFRAGADELLGQLRDLPEDKQGGAGFATAEFAVHAWDLAQGTGADIAWDDSVAETALAAMQQGLTDETRGDAFGAEVAVPADAGAYDRLVAFAGRDPQA